MLYHTDSVRTGPVWVPCCASRTHTLCQPYPHAVPAVPTRCATLLPPHTHTQIGAANRLEVDRPVRLVVPRPGYYTFSSETYPFLRGQVLVTHKVGGGRGAGAGYTQGVGEGAYFL